MPRGVAAAVVAALALAGATTTHAQDPYSGPVEEGVREQSCRALASSSAGLPDQFAAEGDSGALDALPPAPDGLLPPDIHLRGEQDTFNRRYAFATRNGTIYAQRREGANRTWHELQLPPCFAGRVESISVDDDELIALDASRRIFTMDGALKDTSGFNWTSRWGTPFWAGPGYQLPPNVIAWSWSVISPVEDQTWTDPAGNHTAVGGGKVSHIWGLRDGGQRLTFWDPWLALDESYEMCGPLRGRFKAVNLSSSGSFVFVVGPNGDLFTRLYDFDISGHDPLFFSYSYEDQRGKGDGAPIQLPAAQWVRQPKIRGRITSAISIHKVGTAAVHRTLRVEGLDSSGNTGYWEKDVTERAWTFHRTDRPLSAKRLHNPRKDTSKRGMGKPEDRRYVLKAPNFRAELANFNVVLLPRPPARPAQGRPQVVRPRAAQRRRPAPAAPRPRPRRRRARAVRPGRGAAQAAEARVRARRAARQPPHRRDGQRHRHAGAARGARLDLLAVTDAVEEAQKLLRSDQTWQWSTVALLGLCMYVYAVEVERRRFDIVLAGLAFWLMDWFNELANSAILHASDRAPLWATTGDTSYLILIGLTIEISLLFLISGVVFVKQLPADRSMRILGIPNRLFLVTVFSAFCVAVEIFLVEEAGSFHWDYWWWSTSFPFLIVIFGYMTFFGIAAWVYDMGENRRKQLRVVGAVAAIDVVFAVALGIAGWL